MKVRGDQTPIQLDAYLKKVQSNNLKPGDNPGTPGPSSTVDQVNLSNKAMALQKATQALSANETERTEKMAQVKMEVEKGTYQVNGAKVAKDMLKEAFENNAILNKIDTHA